MTFFLLVCKVIYQDEVQSYLILTQLPLYAFAGEAIIKGNEA